MENRCSKCNRVVLETIHTSTSWKIDYTIKNQNSKGEGKILCVDCTKKK